MLYLKTITHLSKGMQKIIIIILNILIKPHVFGDFIDDTICFLNFKLL